MDSFILFFQQKPLIAVFLTVGLGFWLGKLRLKSFSMGPVAATLIVGVIIGQMKIVIPDIFKTVFFLFFLFSIGYSVGPQFFRSFRGNGSKMVVFAVSEALICAATIVGASWLMGYNNGIGAGLFAGSQTASACLGLLADTVKETASDQSRREYLLAIIPACYAVTYVFGTIGSAWFLSVVGPKMLGGLKKVKDEAAAMEQKMDGSGSNALSPGQIRAGRPIAFRAFQAGTEFFSEGISVHDLEQKLNENGLRIVVERIMPKDSHEIITARNETLIHSGDIIAIGGRRDSIVKAGAMIGPEKVASDLLNFSAERIPVTVSHKGFAGKTLGELRNMPWMDGVIISTLTRNGMNLPMRSLTELQPGDIITIVGFPKDVTAAASRIGYADAQSNVSDMVFIGLGIAAGCILGSFSIRINEIPMSLGLSVGTLIVGLVLGWYRNKRPSFGHIPAPVLWMFSNLGLNMFIAVIGISAGASFLHGIREAGVLIFVVGGVCTLLTLAISILLAKKVFRFSSPETLGCVAGGRCAVAAIGAVLDKLQSDVPNLGYTVTYAVANIALVFSSLIVLFMV